MELAALVLSTAISFSGLGIKIAALRNEYRIGGGLLIAFHTNTPVAQIF
jgi:hypothetical protein